MAYWWVNQKKTFEASAKGGFLWSPKRKTDGHRSAFYENMTLARPGDVIFAFADKQIRALAIVSGAHAEMARPESFKTADSDWNNDGWMVPVQYQLVEVPLEVRNHMDLLGQHLPYKYAPIKPSGKANEAYLCPVPEGMADDLLNLLQTDREELRQWQEDVAVSSAIRSIQNDATLSTTQKKQLINARVGQGKFRSNVRDIEPMCRVTGTTNPNFLIASHIKRWSESDNRERLDGNNGLMLAPHIDRLFDRWLISFTDDGVMIFSEALPDGLRAQWGLEQKIAPKPFNAEQTRYLEGHRERLVSI